MIPGLQYRNPKCAAPVPPNKNETTISLPTPGKCINGANAPFHPTARHLFCLTPSQSSSN
ncbi:hypothetical protein BGZ61DRAFT_23969 [Ilyonectria robusta]|uniref:uncharacterized protein n=1 Tax=Ilyonectria robusta TaxID=1079257 RepID=UPI001E8D1F78|nr:uncharacterized protein BGZ61DRAFT_23969 [Ilyonectria robusta]KAH8737865.1 hypothetical protein BGZ61DRAFT_23969 [Ilyonectria robusta]